MPDLTLFALVMSWELCGQGQLGALVVCRGTSVSCLCLQQLLGHPQILSCLTDMKSKEGTDERLRGWKLGVWLKSELQRQLRFSHSEDSQVSQWVCRSCSSTAHTAQCPPRTKALPLALPRDSCCPHGKKGLSTLVSFWEETWNATTG